MRKSLHHNNHKSSDLLIWKSAEHFLYFCNQQEFYINSICHHRHLKGDPWSLPCSFLSCLTFLHPTCSSLWDLLLQKGHFTCHGRSIVTVFIENETPPHCSLGYCVLITVGLEKIYRIASSRQSMRLLVMTAVGFQLMINSSRLVMRNRVWESRETLFK